MSSDVAIRVRNLSKCYQIYDRPHDRLKQSLYPRLQKLVGKPPKQYHREFWALKDVSFEVKKGETIGIIGRNGSGKSTLLQLICGTLTPTGGAVETDGRIAALLELGSGFNPEFTGRENVYMNASILGLTEAEIDARYDDIVAFADIGEFIEQPVRTYSSGMYVRLAFAVIAHVDADILIIDEALAVGDAFFTQKCMRFLRAFREHGTVLFVSHDTGAVINFCHHAIWLEKGQQKLSGSAKEVCEAYLAAFYESQQGPSQDRVDEPKHTEKKIQPIRTKRDQRLDFINCSNLRNDLEVFSFRPDTSGFGLRGATIEGVRFTDIEGNQLIWVVGSEEVLLEIEVAAHQPISGVLVGFLVNDRLGQPLFGDNTFLTYADNPISVSAGDRFVARFHFTMPILPRGEYTVTVAVAAGTQHEHIQHHWIYDALLIKSHSSSVSTGLVGIPMSSIMIEILK
jgi:lipopolysaccharide transport system ATP-binding protein